MISEDIGRIFRFFYVLVLALGCVLVPGRSQVLASRTSPCIALMREAGFSTREVERVTLPPATTRLCRELRTTIVLDDAPDSEIDDDDQDERSIAAIVGSFPGLRQCEACSPRVRFVHALLTAAVLEIYATRVQNNLQTMLASDLPEQEIARLAVAHFEIALRAYEQARLGVGELGMQALEGELARRVVDLRAHIAALRAVQGRTASAVAPERREPETPRVSSTARPSAPARRLLVVGLPYVGVTAPLSDAEIESITDAVRMQLAMTRALPLVDAAQTRALAVEARRHAETRASRDGARLSDFMASLVAQAPDALIASVLVDCESVCGVSVELEERSVARPAALPASFHAPVRGRAETLASWLTAVSELRSGRAQGALGVMYGASRGLHVERATVYGEGLREEDLRAFFGREEARLRACSASGYRYEVALEVSREGVVRVLRERVSPGEPSACVRARIEAMRFGAATTARRALVHFTSR